MFIETHNTSINGTPLVFIKSTKIQAYPCGRRRSASVDTDNNPETVTDQYYIPFDPEARLNTEANNRKYSSLNGFTQTYLNKWDETKKLLTLSLSGYLFSIDLKDGDKGTDPDKFGTSALTEMYGEDSPALEDNSSLYANILVEETSLFQGFKNYNTEILRNQTDDVALTTLDLPRTNITDYTDYEQYYFSGLSFSTKPLTQTSDEQSVEDPVSIREIIEEGKPRQYIVSLHILEKVNNTWQIYQPALLPEIKHGDTENSVKLGTVLADAINLSTAEGGPVVVPALKLVETGTGTWQLQFSDATILPNTKAIESSDK